MPEYPVEWRRNSGATVGIGSMSNYHLIASYRRVLRAQREVAAGVSLDPVQQEEALPYLLAEIERRGLDPKWKSGKPPANEPPMEGDTLPEMER